MAERCIKGDYIGFTFGGVHSSELGLMRVSDGSRYNQDLLPPLQDKVAQVNGRDGAIYFGSQYNTRPIKVPVAFDNMTEESFNQLKKLLQDKKPKYLWFDETPYKQWLVKAANMQNFKWVCFDESHNGKEKRIYKGEGTLEFSCFSPYAESRVTFLDEPVDKIIYKEGKKLVFGNPPFLEEITIEDNTGANNIQHIYSSAILNNESSDNIFNIPNYGTLDLSTNDSIDKEGKIIANKKAYVKFYNDQGYFSMIEHDAPGKGDNVDDVTDGINGTGSAFLSSMHRIFENSDGYSTDIYHIVKCYIVSPEQKEIIKTWSKNATQSLELRCQNYGHHYPFFETIFLSSKEIVKTGKYYNWSLFPTQTNKGARNTPVLLIENDKGKLTVLTPTWKDIDEDLKTSTSEGRERMMSNILSGGEKEIPLGEIQINQLGVKILSPKGFEKINNSIYPTKRLLHLSYNYAEWAKSSRLREQYGIDGNPLYNIYDNGNNLMSVYNAGDIPTDCQIIISKTNLENYTLSNTNSIKFSITSSLDTITEVGKLIIKSFSLLNGDEGIILDSKLKLIKGYRLRQDGSIELTGTVYNKYKKEGDFFKIPVCADEEYYEVRSYANIPFEIQYKHHYI